MNDESAFAEYQLNVDLWKHDDSLRQTHNQTFLGVNSAVLIAAGLIISASDELVVQGLTAMLASIFGILVCSVWRRVQIRHNAYIGYHRKKLAALERGLDLSTFQEQDRAFHDPWISLQLAPNQEPFSLRPEERKSASAAEAHLPHMMMGLWIVAFAGGGTALLCA